MAGGMHILKGIIRFRTYEYGSKAQYRLIRAVTVSEPRTPNTAQTLILQMFVAATPRLKFLGQGTQRTMTSPAQYHLPVYLCVYIPAFFLPTMPLHRSGQWFRCETVTPEQHTCGGAGGCKACTPAVMIPDTCKEECKAHTCRTNRHMSSKTVSCL